MLVGVSLGPGNPGLLTLLAADTLRRSARVFVPGEMASDLAAPYCKPEILDFPMIDDRSTLERIWAKNADHVAEFAAKELTSFACIGDVNTFSTFTHLARLMRERHPLVEISSIPGVSAVSALASMMGCGLERSFTVSDGSEVDTVIRMKATRPLAIAATLQKEGFDEFALGIKLSTPEERMVIGEMPEKSDYFSVLYAHKKHSRQRRRETTDDDEMI
jgi:precorrin-2/cobalt-factor-2 C20-methyltransferase